MSHLRLFVLGSPRLERDGQLVDVERRRALALLVYLAVTGESHRRDALATLFWPEYGHTRARAALRRILAALTKALGAQTLEATRDVIGVRHRANAGDLWLDIDHFHTLLAACRTHGHPETDVCSACLEPLREAVALYRGDFLVGFTLRDTPDFDDWQLFQAETLRREVAGALERLAHGYSAHQEFETAISYARRWLALDPLHEPAHCSLMSLYAQTGQRQAALRQYAKCARLLEREFGVAPQPETTELYEAIRDQRFVPVARQIALPELPHAEQRTRANIAQPSREPVPADQSVSLLDRIGHSTLIGRERQLAQMRALWQWATGGEGLVVLVSGEAGIGKTRLVREVVALANTAHGRVLIGGCHAEGSAPYAPIAQMIRTTLDAAHDTDRAMPDFVLADLLTLAPQLRPRYPQINPNPPLERPYERERLFDSFVAWCEILAHHGPLLLVVEDLHWADSGTIALLRHLAQRVRGMRLFLVMTFRDTEVELAEARSLQELVLDLNRERLAESMHLTRLNREQTGALLATLLGTDGGISAEFLESMYHETEGNPFFVEEVCRALIEAGKLYYVGGSWRRADVQTMVVPRSVRAAILARVERLPSVVQETLRLAAILGREFDFLTLQTMGEWDQETLIDALEYAARAQLLSEEQRAGQLRFAFAHALIPFALRENLSGLRRQRLHHRAATVIEAQRPNDWEALAFHFAAAGERGKAIEYSRRAAQRAQDLYAYETAMQHLHVALNLLEAEEPSEARLAVLEQLADVHRLRDERAIAVSLYQEALELWHGLSGADTMIGVRLCRKFGETVCKTDYITEVLPFEVTARAALHEGMRLMADAPPHPETVRLLISLSQDAWRMRIPQDWETAERYARAAVNMAEQLDAPIELSSALDALAVVYAARGLFHERVHIARRRLVLSREAEFTDPRERLHLVSEAGVALIDVGQYVEAMPYLREAERLASQTHAIDELVRVLHLQALCAFRLDRWDDVPMDEKYLVLGQRHQHERLTPSCFHLALRACVHALRGEIHHARTLREESLARMSRAVPPEQWERPSHY